MYSGRKKSRSLGIKLDLSYAHYTLLLHPHTLTHPHMHTPHTCTPISSSSGAGLNATRGEVKRKRYQSHTSVSRCIEAAKTISSKARLHTKRRSHLIGKRRQHTVQQPNRHRGTVGTHIKKFFFSKHFYAGGIEVASFPGSSLVPGKWPRSWEVASFPGSSLVPVFDCFQYAKIYCKRSKTGAREGLAMRPRSKGTVKIATQC